jgi:hypothetical protein
MNHLLRSLILGSALLVATVGSTTQNYNSDPQQYLAPPSSMVWGPVSGGIQCGLTMKSAGATNHRQFVRLYIRNTSTSDISILDFTLMELARGLVVKDDTGAVQPSDAAALGRQPRESPSGPFLKETVRSGQFVPSEYMILFKPIAPTGRYSVNFDVPLALVDVPHPIDLRCAPTTFTI